MDDNGILNIWLSRLSPYILLAKDMGNRTAGAAAPDSALTSLAYLHYLNYKQTTADPYHDFTNV